MHHKSAPIDILFVIAPHSLLLDIAGPAEAFRLVNLRRSEAGKAPHFRLRFTGPAPLVPTSVGLSIAQLEPLPDALTTTTWIVLVGQPIVHVRRTTPEIIETTRWLNRIVRPALNEPGSSHRLLTICSGTLLAARSGLLDGRRCTTHHDLLDTLKSLAPQVSVQRNRVFVVDGCVASSAGITAGIDLALHLISAECGEAMATDVAEDMVVYLRRSPRDAELSPYLRHRRHRAAAVHRVQEAISATPEREWNMRRMADVAHVTERHVLRLFVQHCGVSPLEFLRGIRLERARQLITRGTSIAKAAETSGFSSSLHLRRAWKRQWGGLPRDAREISSSDLVNGSRIRVEKRRPRTPPISSTRAGR
jgi:transcriptional regulator GlxA family with amidase domain